MRGLGKDTAVLIKYAYQILRADHPMTLRQLHYAIFSKKEIGYDNTQADYKRLSRVTTYARRLHREFELQAPDWIRLPDTSWEKHERAAPEYGIPSDWIVDETREAETVNVFRNADSYISAVSWSYRRDNWQDQPRHVEVWTEKARVLGSIRDTANELGITLRVYRGFGSTGMEGQIGREFAGIAKNITILFLGDHDPSGRVIEQDIHHRAQVAAGRKFEMVRLAIHPEDIRKFNLPPQKIKTTDSRAAAFRQQYGNDAATVELDALPAAELRRRITEAVSGLIDHERWDRQIAVQAVELRCIKDFAERVRKLAQINPEMHP